MRDCGHQIKLVWSHQAPDSVLDGTIVEGERQELWQVCGKRRGHHGEHGPGSRLRRLARKLGWT